MADNRDFFTPEQVEEQVAWLRQQPPAHQGSQRYPGDRQLVEDLQRLYQSEKAAARSLDQVWSRLESQGISTPGPSQTPPHAPSQPSRPPSHAFPPAVPARRRLSTRFLTIAAAVLLVVVVSGLVGGLVLSQHPTHVTTHPTTTPGGVAATATTSPTQGVLFAVSNGDTVVALDAATGSVRWQHPFTVPTNFVLSIKAIVDQTVYVDLFINFSKAAYEGQPDTLTALDAKDGTQRWQTADYRGYTLSGGLVIASSPTGLALSALDEQTGNTLWTFQPPQGTYIGGGIVTSGTVYSQGATQNNYFIYAINATNGKERWYLSNPSFSLSFSLLTATNESAYVIIRLSSGETPILAALNASDGTERWHIQTVDGDYDWSMVVLNGVVYAAALGDDRGGTGQGILYALNASDGKELWHTPPAQDSRSFSAPTVSQGVVYISDGAGVYAFDAASGQQLWHTKPGGWSGNEPPVVQDGLIYMNWYATSTTIGRTPLVLSVLDARTGAERWHATVADDPAFDPEEGPPPSPFVANGIVFVTTADGVQALRGSDGKPLWQNNTLTSLMVATN